MAKDSRSTMKAARCDEFYLIWESGCRNFIEDVQFSSHEAKTSRIKTHVFLRKDTPLKAQPPKDTWLESHYSLTTSPFASSTGLISHILWEHWNHSAKFDDQDITRTLYLVSDRERQYDELIATLKSFVPSLDVREVNGTEKTIFDIVRDSCKFCNLIFLNKDETKEHELEQHHFFCDNASCYGYKQRFCSEEALLKHKAAQKKCLYCGEVLCSDEAWKEHLIQEHDNKKLGLKAGTKQTTTLSKHLHKPIRSQMKISCQFCPRKEFSSLDQKEIHMKHSHKKCNCSCGEYFETREEYLDHFYSVYPLPCYENRKCPHRFQNVFLQAAHHREFHYSSSPFYCVPCQKRKVEDPGQRTMKKTSFKDESGLRLHGMTMGHLETEMFLSNLMETLNTNVPEQKTFSRTCSNLNHC